MPVTRSQATINGKPLTFETGKYAKQAGGAATVQYGDTVVFAAATVAKTIRTGIDFFPLTVDFEERLYAAGNIPGWIPRREGRPSEEGILTARLTDRPIRPLFPKGFRNDVQIIVSAWSADQENDYDVLAVNAASAALTVSNAPFEGPIGCVRVGTVDGELTLNPTIQQMQESKLDLIVAGTRDSIMMMEAGAHEVTEDFLIQALALAQEGIKKLCDAQMDLQRASGKPKMEFITVVPDPARLGAVTSFLSQRLRAKLRNPDKAQREAGLDELKLEAVAQFATGENAPLTLEEVSAVYEELLEEEFRKAVTEENLRPDGRGTKDIRQLSIEVGVLPRTHGSAVFTRGQTQVLSVATLGPGGDEQIIDTLSPVDTKRYMHHYNFPPYSVGEVRMMRGAGRREIGHGALAERAILPVLPTKEEFPYTIRVVSETLESNGSSSMASTCGSTLALMDAGVPIKEMIGGIAMGLVTFGDKWTVLTDIQGLEDHYGKMVRAIQAETGTTIELEDDGTVRITGAKAEGREKARAMIEGLTKEPEVGEIYDGKVTRIMSIGAFVEYLPGKEGLVRVSEISSERVNSVEDAVKVGDKVKVKVAEVDRMGRVNLSIRAVNENGNDYEARQRAERERYRDRDERGGGARPGGPGGFRRGGPPRR